MREYSIGEVCRLLEVKPHVLRYWEQEFSMLSPRKDHFGKRLYGEAELHMLYRIKHLLYGQRYTIEGARERLFHEMTGERQTGKGLVQDLRGRLVRVSLILDGQRERLERMESLLA